MKPDFVNFAAGILIGVMTMISAVSAFQTQGDSAYIAAQIWIAADLVMLALWRGEK